MEKIKGFKAFNKGLKCKNKTYKENTTFKENGNIGICEKGMHFCEMPLDVLNYYPYNPNETEFAEVEAIGDIKKDDNKTVTNKLRIKSKISFQKLLKLHFDLVFEKVIVNKDTTNTAGDRAHANTAGYYAHANTAGYRAHANTAGNEAHANTAGDEAHANTAGDRAHANTAGNRAHANTAGYRAISSAIGIQSKAKAINGWIIITDWQQDKNYDWKIKNIYSKKIGQKIKGVVIKSNVWYWFENGKLKNSKTI